MIIYCWYLFANVSGFYCWNTKRVCVYVYVCVRECMKWHIYKSCWHVVELARLFCNYRNQRSKIACRRRKHQYIFTELFHSLFSSQSFSLYVWTISLFPHLILNNNCYRYTLHSAAEKNHAKKTTLKLSKYVHWTHSLWSIRVHSTWGAQWVYQGQWTVKNKWNWIPLNQTIERVLVWMRVSVQYEEKAHPISSNVIHIWDTVSKWK